MLYLAAFSPGMGPVPWAVNAEIYPVQVNSFSFSLLHVVGMSHITLATLQPFHAINKTAVCRCMMFLLQQDTLFFCGWVSL